MKFISEISEMFAVRSNSSEVTKDESNDGDNDFFFDIFDDITKKARLKFAWWMFKARQYQRRRRMETKLHERRKMYEHSSSNSCSNANHANMLNTATRNGVTKRVGVAKRVPANVTQPTNSQRTSKLYGQNVGVPDNVVITSSANSLGSAVSDNGKIDANNLPRRCQRQGANRILPRQRVSTNDVKERVAVQLAARREEIAGMTSAQRIAHFRNKYGLNENKD